MKINANITATMTLLRALENTDYTPEQWEAVQTAIKLLYEQARREKAQ